MTDTQPPPEAPAPTEGTAPAAPAALPVSVEPLVEAYELPTVSAPVVPHSLLVAAHIGWRFLVLAAALVVLLLLLNFFKVLVVPLLVAVLLTALMLPLVELLVRLKVPRGLAVTISVLLGMGVVGGLFTLVGTQLADGLADLSDQARQAYDSARNWLSDGPLGLSSAQIGSLFQEARSGLAPGGEEVAAQALVITATAGEIITGAFLAIFSLIFLLLEGDRIWRWMVQLLPGNVREPVDEAGREGWKTLTSYVRATIGVASIDAVGIGTGAALLGVPLALPLAVLVFLGAFVPIVGALVSGAVAVVVALLALGPIQALLMLAVVIGVQQVEAHLLQPLLLGRAVSVHPLAVVLAIGAGLITAGVAGALFSVPLVAFLNTAVHSLRGRENTWVTELRRPQLRVDLRRHAPRVRRRRP